MCGVIITWDGEDYNCILRFLPCMCSVYHNKLGRGMLHYCCTYNIRSLKNFDEISKIDYLMQKYASYLCIKSIKACNQFYLLFNVENLQCWYGLHKKAIQGRFGQLIGGLNPLLKVISALKLLYKMLYGHPSRHVSLKLESLYTQGNRYMIFQLI